MSNSIIENIVTDVDGFRARFLWIEDASLVKQETWIHDVSMLEFFPIVGLVQEMLKEIGQLRTTMNDLQLEYVKKVEESDVRLEEEVLRKQKQQQQQQQQQQITHKEQSKTSSALTWFSNVFQRSPTTPTSKEKKSVQPMASHGSLHARFMASNISDVSVHSTSIHPLSKPKTIPCPSNSNTTAATERSSNKMAIRRQKSDIDRYGPPSSFPTRSPAVAIGNEKSKRRSTSTAIATSSSVSFSSSPNSNNLPLHSSTSSTGSNSTKVTIPLRASQSAGTVRKSQSMQASALEFVVRRKRSTLGLSSSSSNDYDLPQSTSSELTGAFTTTSWLGNK